MSDLTDRLAEALRDMKRIGYWQPSGDKTLAEYDASRKPKPDAAERAAERWILSLPFGLAKDRLDSLHHAIREEIARDNAERDARDNIVKALSDDIHARPWGAGSVVQSLNDAVRRAFGWTDK